MAFLTEEDFAAIKQEIEAAKGLSDCEKEVLVSLTIHRDVRRLNDIDILKLVYCVRKMDVRRMRVAVVHALTDIVAIRPFLFNEDHKQNIQYAELVEIVKDCPDCAIATLDLMRELAYWPLSLRRMIDANVHRFLGDLLARYIPQEVIAAVIWTLTVMFDRIRGDPGYTEKMLRDTMVVSQFQQAQERILNSPQRGSMLRQWSPLTAIVAEINQQLNTARLSTPEALSRVI